MGEVSYCHFHRVKCFNVIYWGGCTDGKSSHSCTEGYLVDVETETITAKTSWYSQYFVNMEPKQLGMKVPGIKEAVQDAINAHEAHPHKWCRVIGWDCILTDGKPCFFEGNLAAHRTPRRVMLGPHIHAHIHSSLFTHPSSAESIVKMSN